MEPRAQAHLALSFPRSVTGLTGEVVIERVYADRSVRIVDYPVKYEGLGAEKLALTFTAPEDPSLYRVRFVKSGAEDVGASDDFFIQDTLVE
jgi:hypothetical protein